MPRPRELQDKYFRQAKREGYVARSAYKLIEIQNKHRVLRSGDWVLDLGCAPGSWLQVAAEIVSAPPRPRPRPDRRGPGQRGGAKSRIGGPRAGIRRGRHGRELVLEGKHTGPSSPGHSADAAGSQHGSGATTGTGTRPFYPGLVVGLDLKPVTIDMPANVRTLVGDIHNATPESLLNMIEQIEADDRAARPEHATDGPDDAATTQPETAITAASNPTPRIIRPEDFLAGFHVVLSDMAPNTSGGGGGSVDHFRSIRLCETVLDVAQRVVRPGGRLVMKVFDGEAFPDLLARTRHEYKKVVCIKPDATRDLSRELYVIAFGRKAPWRGKNRDRDDGQTTPDPLLPACE